MILTARALQQLCLSCGHPLSAIDLNIAHRADEDNADDAATATSYVLDWSASHSILEQAGLIILP
jgi:hypothetical protein